MKLKTTSTYSLKDKTVCPGLGIRLLLFFIVNMVTSTYSTLKYKLRSLPLFPTTTQSFMPNCGVLPKSCELLSNVDIAIDYIKS